MFILLRGSSNAPICSNASLLAPDLCRCWGWGREYLQPLPHLLWWHETNQSLGLAPDGPLAESCHVVQWVEHSQVGFGRMALSLWHCRIHDTSDMGWYKPMPFRSDIQQATFSMRLKWDCWRDTSLSPGPIMFCLDPCSMWSSIQFNNIDILERFGEWLRVLDTGTSEQVSNLSHDSRITEDIKPADDQSVKVAMLTLDPLQPCSCCVRLQASTFLFMICTQGYKREH